MQDLAQRLTVKSSSAMPLLRSPARLVAYYRVGQTRKGGAPSAPVQRISKKRDGGTVSLIFCQDLMLELNTTIISTKVAGIINA
ncbi:hypothetical protein PoB_000362800 [Plakobranchus ocellatus]|uniref:Uncharacterized protein n=1 Tax=Plakobranchus ocellatus TaxID=259542 RepID=A0AAV3Y4K0_9GAST|nr:hypothetical protein PoB_000362800 [Plakobranchus ocellatus]